MYLSELSAFINIRDLDNLASEFVSFFFFFSENDSWT